MVKQVLVTGASGFVGSHLAETLHSMSNEVVVTDDQISEIVPSTPMGYDEAVREAFRQRAAAKLKS
jgi:nucleoside-diphosphate-sugar epimerase